MFILLVTAPGVGKSLVLREIMKFWFAAGCQPGPFKLTKEGLLDHLALQREHEFQSGLFCASEFGNLVPEHDMAWLNLLNDLYDNPPNPIEERTRSRGALVINKPFLHIIAGSQPKYLDSLLPDAAFGMGFMSRIIMIYGESVARQGFFSRIRPPAGLESRLINDLKIIRQARGCFDMSQETMEYFEELYNGFFAPQPTHTKLQGYNNRRELQILKLAMGFSISESNEMIVTNDHIDQALALLHEAEARMPQIFRDMGSAPQSEVIDEVYEYCLDDFMRFGKPIPEPKLMNYMRNKVAMTQVPYMLNLMVQANLLKKGTDVVDRTAITVYTPVPQDGNARTGLEE